jgi:hypothetical protein
MPAQRPQVTGESIVPFREAPAGSPPAARYWYYAGQTNGLEFAYPGAQAKTIASAAKEPVLALDTDSPNPQDMKSAGFTRVTQEGTAEPLPPETVMWQATALKLNPFTHLAITYQEILFFAGPVGHLKWLLVLGAISVVFFLFGYWVFDRLRDTFAEEV